MKTILVDIVVNTNNIENFETLVSKEIETVQRWKNTGIIELLFMKENKTGVFLILKGNDLEKSKELVSTLPLYPYFETTKFTILNKQF